MSVQVLNRFFSQMTMQYSDIYIRELGATPLQLGGVNSAAGLGRTLISMPLGYLQDRYSVKKIYLGMFTLLTMIPLFYALAYRWELIIPAILITGLGVQYSCNMICDLSLPNRDRATGKALCEGVGALSALLAPILASVLVTWFGGISVAGIRPLYWIQFAVLVILLIFVSLTLKEVVRPKRILETVSPWSEFKEVFQRARAGNQNRGDAERRRQAF